MHSSLKGAVCQGRSKADASRSWLSKWRWEAFQSRAGRGAMFAGSFQGQRFWVGMVRAVTQSLSNPEQPADKETESSKATRQPRNHKSMDGQMWLEEDAKKKKSHHKGKSKQQDGQKNIYNTHDKTGVDGCWFTEFITREKMMNNSIGKRVPDLKRRIKRKGIQMDNKCIKICSDSSTIKETQIKMKCLFLFIGLARILKYHPIQQ